MQARFISRSQLVPLLLLCVFSSVFFLSSANGQSPSGGGEGNGNEPGAQNFASVRSLLIEYCVDCHNRDSAEGDFLIDALLEQPTSEHRKQWEAIVHRVAARQMPPVDGNRPSESEYEQIVGTLVDMLDVEASQHPNPGRTETFRRLTQTEYRNAVRDLLDLDVDVSELLPADESSHGFDNVTVTGLSPVLLERYVSAAQKIARLAMGVRAEAGGEATYRVPPDVTQDAHLPGTPIGTRGGIVIQHNFPQDGEYEIQAWLMRDRNEGIEGLRGKSQLLILVDREQLETLTIEPSSKGSSDSAVDANLKIKANVTAGPHEVAVVFQKKPSSLLETVRQPLNVHFNYYRHPRLEPAIYQVSIRGPGDGRVPQQTPSRKKILTCQPSSPDQEEGCAKQILSALMRRAYRREITDDDLAVVLKFFRQSQHYGFDAAIESALAAILVNPNFLFRIEREPEGLANETCYPISEVELASRLSFFLWSSIPDDELLGLATNGQLRRPDVLKQQVDRMLADPKAKSLTSNFADQWLYLRNLDSVIPDMRAYPDFDENLRQAMRAETELFFESIVQEDSSVLKLLDADYTYLNERLAKHYNIDHVYGSHFRRVTVSNDSHRGGLLRHGSILSVTSYATRTSPVLRGHWVLKNLLGSSPPPPPPNVPALTDNTVSAKLSVRERLEQHRADASCAVCHNLLDPIGFSLENFDAVGRWRETENDQPLAVDGGLPDGSEFESVDGLEQAILKRPELFVQTLTEKLMTFALGRGVEYYDAPAIRKVVRDARDSNYRFSSIVTGIVESVPFQMRSTE